VQEKIVFVQTFFLVEISPFTSIAIGMVCATSIHQGRIAITTCEVLLNNKARSIITRRSNRNTTHPSHAVGDTVAMIASITARDLAVYVQYWKNARQRLMLPHQRLRAWRVAGRTTT
jgi:hypothetical protein